MAEMTLGLLVLILILIWAPGLLVVALESSGKTLSRSEFCRKLFIYVSIAVIAKMIGIVLAGDNPAYIMEIDRITSLISLIVSLLLLRAMVQRLRDGSFGKGWAYAAAIFPVINLIVMLVLVFTPPSTGRQQD